MVVEALSEEKDEEKTQSSLFSSSLCRITLFDVSLLASSPPIPFSYLLVRAPK